MFQKKCNWIKLNIVPILIIILYVSESYFKIVNFSFGLSPNIFKVFKFVVLLIISSYIFYYKTKALLGLFVLTIFFCIGQLALNNSFETDVVIVYGKLIYLILLLIFFDIYKLTKRQHFKMLKAFEAILVFNSLLVVIGFLFNIFLFKTYMGGRFGYNGLLVTSATSSYFYIIALIYLVLKDREFFFKKSINILVIVASLLVGTKALYLFMIGLLCVYVFSFVRKNIRSIFLLGILLVSFIFGYLFLFIFSNFNRVRKVDGLFSALMSYRNNLFSDKLLPFIKENWNAINYLFGGIDNVVTKSQIDIIDIFYILGIVGGLFYLISFFRLFIPVKVSFPLAILLGLMLFIVCLAGNFFSYASVATYIVILREYLKDYENS